MQLSRRWRLKHSRSSCNTGNAWQFPFTFTPIANACSAPRAVTRKEAAGLVAATGAALVTAAVLEVCVGTRVPGARTNDWWQYYGERPSAVTLLAAAAAAAAACSGSPPLGGLLFM